MDVPLYQVDAFTNRRFAGNPAAVVGCPQGASQLACLRAKPVSELLANAMQPMPGAGGGFEVREISGDLTYDGTMFCSPTVGVAEPGALPGPLVGRADFFMRWVVRFAWHRTPPDFNVDPVKK